MAKRQGRGISKGGQGRKSNGGYSHESFNFKDNLPLGVDVNDPYRVRHLAKTVTREGTSSFSEEELQVLLETARRLHKKSTATRARTRHVWNRVSRAQR